MPRLADGLVSASIGIAIYPLGCRRPDQSLISHADTALYRAKTDRQRTLYRYLRGVDGRRRRATSRRDGTRIAPGRRACANSTLVYQPQKRDQQPAKSLGFEALIRWRHPRTRRRFAPQHVIPVAEDSGAIRPIGDWVLRRGLPRKPPAGQIRSTIAVNVSAGPASQCPISAAAGARDPA
ncbi:EAL domain-containing protein [Shinella sp.]|uniref:EAL domain-containing protein n=1 Tax=Shinella sp. TaxID=1870904 RepID=UPI003D2CC3DE